MQNSLSELSAPFPESDIEWRVSRSGIGRDGIYCFVLAYITARAIQQRLDDVCGPAGWRNEPMSTFELRPGVVAIQCGISVLCDGTWVTKFDVAEPTNVEPAKGGFSGAMKRAGAQWGIGRYLYHLDEAFAEVSESGGRGWNYARLPEKHGSGSYYWKPPSLPGWALPKESKDEVPATTLNSLKRHWRDVFAPDVTNQADLASGFRRFVEQVVGAFPIDDHTCWTVDAVRKCRERIEATEDPTAISPDVPFE